MQVIVISSAIEYKLKKQEYGKTIELITKTGGQGLSGGGGADIHLPELPMHCLCTDIRQTSHLYPC